MKRSLKEFASFGFGGMVWLYLLRVFCTFLSLFFVLVTYLTHKWYYLWVRYVTKKKLNSETCRTPWVSTIPQGLFSLWWHDIIPLPLWIVRHMKSLALGLEGVLYPSWVRYVVTKKQEEKITNVHSCGFRKCSNLVHNISRFAFTFFLDRFFFVFWRGSTILV